MSGCDEVFFSMNPTADTDALMSTLNSMELGMGNFDSCTGRSPTSSHGHQPSTNTCPFESPIFTAQLERNAHLRPWARFKLKNSEDPGVSEQPQERNSTGRCPPSPVLKGLSPKESEIASMCELFLGQASIAYEVPSSQPALLSNDASQSDPNTFSGAAEKPPQTEKRYLHRGLDGKLTTIPKSPLCEEVPIDEPTRDDSGKCNRVHSPKNHSAEDLSTEQSEDYAANGLVYAGYRIFSKAPRNIPDVFFRSTAEESPAEEADAHAKRKCSPWKHGGPSNQMAADLALSQEKNPASFPFLSDDDSVSSCSDTSSEGEEPPVTNWLSNVPCPKRNWHNERHGATFSSSEAPASQVSMGPHAFPIPRGNQNPSQLPWLSNDPSAERKPSFFGLLSKQEEADPTDRPNHIDAHDMAHMQFRLRRGSLWDLANNNLEKIFAHATDLTEPEFVEFVCCDTKATQTWLDKQGPSIIRRLMKRWMRAHKELVDAGIQPRDVNENMLDIFELMAPRERQAFIEKFHKLASYVKAHEEGLHWTPSEMEHYSRLSLADKAQFVDIAKKQKEQRLKVVRCDTKKFSTQLRRSGLYLDDELPLADCYDLEFFQTNNCKAAQWPLNQMPFADCHDIDFLQTNNCEAAHWPLNQLPFTDCYHLDFPQTNNCKEAECGLGRLRTMPSRAQSMSTPNNQNESVLAQLRRATALTTHGRIPYTILGALELRPTCFPDNRAQVSTPREHAGERDLSSDSEEANGVAECMTALNSLTQKVQLQEMKHTKDNEQTIAATGIVGIQTPQTPALRRSTVCINNDWRRTVGLEAVVPQPHPATLTGPKCNEISIRETFSLMPPLTRSPRRERSVHPGEELPYPTPPPTVRSAEGVIDPIMRHWTSTPYTETTTPVVDTPPVAKSEPCTPFRTIYTDYEGLTTSYASPTRSHRSIRGLSSLFALEHKMKKEKKKSIRNANATAFSEYGLKKAVRHAEITSSSEDDTKEDSLWEINGKRGSLRKKVSTLFDSIRSRKSRGGFN